MKIYSFTKFLLLLLSTEILSQVQFASHPIVEGTNSPCSVYAIDVDGDGDIDVLSSSEGDHKVAWYENLLIVGIEENSASVPSNFILHQNYPNPFNPSTRIQYAISSRQFVAIKVYDVLGNEITNLVNEEKSAGNYSVEFNANNLSSGVYFYKILAGEFQQVRKMLLIR